MVKKDSSVTWYFAYNSDGLRTERTNGTTTYEYIYNGSQLTAMTVGDCVLYFSYDAAGIPMSVNFNGTEYFYTSNIQGDVTGIVNSNGMTVVTYTYDAWGRQLSCTGSMAGTLGMINPLRYRGYVYDQETGLYYLQSRYYNPEIGRFINADGLTATGQGLLGNNMFAYCGNNPINRCDPSGTSWLSKIEEVIEKVRVTIVTRITQAIQSLVQKTRDGYSSSGHLTSVQMHYNASIAYSYLRGQGWSHNATCAALGNMQYESYEINPGRWQDGGGGYGIVQWDPASTYLNWAAQNGYSATSLRGQLECLVYTMQPGNGYWFQDGNKPFLKYSDFIASNAPVDYLTEVFMCSYERPGIPNLERRIECADYWAAYFS